MSADSFQIFEQFMGWTLNSISPIDISVVADSSIIAGRIVLELKRPSDAKSQDSVYLSVQSSGTDESQSIQLTVLDAIARSSNESDQTSAAELSRQLLSPSPFIVTVSELFSHHVTTDSGVRASMCEIVLTSQMAVNFSIVCGPCPDEVTLKLNHNFSGYSDYTVSRLSKIGSLIDG